ncbi:MAG: flagellar FlbD family protein [Lentisphaerae bacterium]|nr:flagellar FlbD family protein [Lentisphaerota bacterium]
MIKLTKISGEEIVLNELYIESIEAASNTTVKIHNGTTFVAQEKPDRILALIREWQQQQTPT